MPGWPRTLQIKCCKNDITTFCAFLFELKNVCLESPGDDNPGDLYLFVWAKNHLSESPGELSKRRSCRDLISGFHLGPIDVCLLWLMANNLQYFKEKKMWLCIHTHKIPQQYYRCLDFSTLFTCLFGYTSRIKIKMLLDDINVDHKATAFRAPLLWAISLHNYLPNGLIFYDLFSFIVWGLPKCIELIFFFPLGNNMLGELLKRPINLACVMLLFVTYGHCSLEPLDKEFQMWIESI